MLRYSSKIDCKARRFVEKPLGFPPLAQLQILLLTCQEQPLQTCLLCLCEHDFNLKNAESEGFSGLVWFLCNF